MNQFVLPKQFVPDENGNPIVGAKVYFYKTGTLQFLTVYQDALFTTPHDPENITSDGSGVFPPIFIKDETYKCAVYDADDVIMSGPHDNLTGQIDLDAIASSQELYNTPVKEIQADYTATVTDLQRNAFLNVKPIANDLTIELPSAAEVGNGYGLTIRNGHASSYVIRVEPKSTTSETIDEADYIEITTFNEQVRLTSDGASWIAAKYEIPHGSVDIDQLAPRLQGAFLATGQIVPWPGKPDQAPAGWLSAEGQLENIADYPDLYEKYGTYYGGDGTTTFGIPDLRGYFLRGLDGGAGIDPDAVTRSARPDGTGGDVIGSTQDDEVISHTHVATSDENGQHDHGYVRPISSGQGGAGAGDIGGERLEDTSNSGLHTHEITVETFGGNETRPKNFAVKWYVVAAPELSAGASGVLTKIYSSDGIPSDTVGIDGDFVFDRTSKIMYGPKAGGSYSGAGVSLSGEDGLDGASNIFVQDTEPAGSDGDIWLHSATGDIKKKASGSWGGSLGNISGADGTDGASIHVQSGEPGGSDGDLWLDSDDGQVNQKSSGSWVDTGLNLTGPAGIKNQGVWSNATSYVQNDVVTNNGSSYICTAAHTNQEPPNASYWDLLAQKGTDGVGTGDVTGPTSSTDNTVPRFSSTTGKVIKSSGITIDGSNNISGAGNFNGRNLLNDGAKLDGIEIGATGDQTGAEIVAAYNDQVPQISSGEITTGTETAIRRYSPADIKSFLDTHASGGGGNGLLHIQDQKAADVDGGNFTSGDWRTRELNAILTNEISGASLLSNQITLPAGDYFIRASAPSYQCEMHRLRIYDVSNSTALLLGPCEYSRSSYAGATRALLNGRFSLTSQSNIELQHRCATTSNNQGFGISSGWGTEIYSEIEIYEVA